MSIIGKVLNNILKGITKNVDPNLPTDYDKKRANDQADNMFSKLPKGVDCELTKLGGISAEYISKKGNDEKRIVLYIHGGGFTSGSAKSRRAITGYIAAKFGYNVYSIDYRLAPENPFPAAPDDSFEAYCVLVERYGAENICIMGESAGATLSLVIPHMARDAKIAMPACVVAFSPVAQNEMNLPSYTENKKGDYMLGATFDGRMQQAYFRTEAPAVLKHPYAAPLHGEMGDFPPTMLVASTTELLRDDSIEFDKKLGENSRESVLILVEDMMHAFPMLPLIPESKKVLKEAKYFIKKHF